MTLADRLRVLAESLPTEGAAVTLNRADLLAMLDQADDGGGLPRQDAEHLMDLSVSDIMEASGRARSTVIGWIHSGQLKSYLFGREHRITRGDWHAFLNRHRGASGDGQAVRRSQGRLVDLSSWRRVKGGAD